MSSHTLTLDVPDKIFARIRDRAREANRTVEAEAIGVLANAVIPTDELPPELAAAMTAVDTLDEIGLRRAAESRLTPEQGEELESLHFKQRREGLTTAEDQIRHDLMREYERSMLVRARSAALLHQRGKNGVASSL